MCRPPSLPSLAVSALLAFYPCLSSAGSINLPWNVSISIPAVAPPYEATWHVDMPFTGASAANVDVGFEFPARFTPAYSINLPYQLTISYPDVVRPGDRVQLTTSLALSGPAQFTTYGAGEFDSRMAMSVEGGDSFPFLSLKDTIGGVIPSGQLWGSWSWVGSDSTGDPSTLGPRWLYDHYGNSWIYLPGLETLIPELKASSLTFQNQETSPAWQVERLELLDMVGNVVPGASLLSYIYDIYIEADNTLRETSTLRTGMVTGYFTYPGIGGVGYEALGLNTGVTPQFDIPSSGLNQGDTFEVRLTALGFDYRTTHLYELMGNNEYGAQMFTFFDVAAIRIGSESFVPLGIWGADHRYFESLADSTTIRFSVAVPEPGTLALLGLGLAGLAATRRRKQ